MKTLIVQVVGILLVATLLICCKRSPVYTSKVLRFEYSGYSDTTVALIFGRVQDTLNPLQQAEVIGYYSNGSELKRVDTDSAGNFSIGFPKGSFKLKVSKPRYQALWVLNYVSDLDQVSSIDIMLQKGGGEAEYKLKDWSRN
jgi:hypothetical protein